MAKALKKTSVTKKAVNKVKETPKKIVEHTLSTAIDAVEKAAVKQEKRTQKATAKKIAKIAKRAMRTAEKNAHTSSSKASAARRAARKIKDKIKMVLHPQKDEIFYYSSKKIVLLNIFYALVTIVAWKMLNCMFVCGFISNWIIFGFCIVLMVTTLLALASSVFVMIFPQKLAVINSKSIKIDHNEVLMWQDVEFAEEKQTNNLTKRSIIALHVKKDAHYNLTFMQKLCKNNIYTPFSIPLYAMTDDDVKEIRILVQKYCKYVNTINK